MKKEIVEKLIAESEFPEFPFFWVKGFNLATLAQKAQFHGLIGSEHWSNENLRMVVERFRAYALGEQFDENKIDALLRDFAEKIAVEINDVRRLFYEPLELPPKEEPAKEKPEEAEES